MHDPKLSNCAGKVKFAQDLLAFNSLEPVGRGARPPWSHSKESWVREMLGKRDRWKASLSQGYLMDARAASLPLAQPHPLYNVCFTLMFIKHHRINAFLHFRDMTSLSVPNDDSSFEKYREKKLWGIIKSHKVDFRFFFVVYKH